MEAPETRSGFYQKQTNTRTNTMTGKIKKIISDKAFGFIAVEGRERDLFFHKQSVTGGSFEDLREGDEVSLDLDESGPKGPAAVNVQPAK